MCLEARNADVQRDEYSYAVRRVVDYLNTRIPKRVQTILNDTSLPSDDLPTPKKPSFLRTPLTR
jgi:hypothetical protein